MVFKKGAFVAGQLSMGISVGKRAEEMLKSGVYSSEAERLELEGEVKNGKALEALLEKHRNDNGL